MAHREDSSHSQRVETFLRLTEPCHQRLFAFALTLCRDKDQAADLTQEALVRAFEAFERFDTAAAVLPWLMRILRNIFLDGIKSGRARFEVAEHQSRAAEAPLWADYPDRAENQAEQLEQAEVLHALRQEVAALEDDQRLALQLCDLDGLSYEEAATVLGVPIGTVRSRLSRARAKLVARMKRRLAPVGQPMEPTAAVNRMVDNDTRSSVDE